MSARISPIPVKTLLEGLKGSVLFDVRSPGEFQKGHIPGAKNLPLFSDEERAEVGTIFKQQSAETAFERGLEIAGAKMVDYVRSARKLAMEQEVVLHCWRGGQRSQSMAWLLDKAGFSVYILKGGYKAYRRKIHQFFVEVNANFVVIGGKTGVGKTDILNHLHLLGEQVIDLEQLANHKGSAFGALGQMPQPTTEQFENTLFEILRKLDINQRIWLENESRTIGTVYLPDDFLGKMKSGVLFNIEMPLGCRVERLTREYADFPKKDLIEAFQKIKKRLGGQNLKIAREAIENGSFDKAAATALRYYDKTYLHAVNRWPFKKRIEVEIDEDDPERTAQLLKDIADAENL